MLIHAKLYTSAGLLLLFVFFVTFTLNSCKEQTPSSIEPGKLPPYSLSKAGLPPKEEVAFDIKTIAEGLAVLLRDEQYRRILQMEKENSNRVLEEKCDAVKFITTERNIVVSGAAQRTSMVRLFHNLVIEEEREKFMRSIAALPPGTIDIYFPVRKHRESWRSADSKMLILPVPPDAEEDLDVPLEAYDLDGNRVALSKKAPPETPTLVVTLNETGGKYISKSDARNQPLPDEGGGGGGGGTPLWHWNVNYLRIGQRYDPAFESEMEIYFKRWWDTSGWHESPIYIVPNNDVRTITLNYDLAAFPSSGTGMVFEIWEDDAWFNGGDDFVADQWYQRQNYSDYYPVCAPAYGNFFPAMMCNGQMNRATYTDSAGPDDIDVGSIRFPYY